MHDWILDFVRVDGVLIVDACLEIFALQHLLQRHTAVEANDIFERHRPKPVAVADCLRTCGIENLERLFPVGFGICHYLLVR